MSADLPRLLIVSEVTFNKEGKGATRTLFNLFKNYPVEKLLLLAPENALKQQPPSPPFNQQVISFPGYQPPINLNNRFGKLFKPWLLATKIQLLDWLPIPHLQTLEAFQPEVIFVCPHNIRYLRIGQKLARHFRCPSLIYLMDDWLANKKLWWLSGNTQQVAYQSLQEATGWLMISEQLQTELSRRYQIQPQRSLIVHNPVELTGKEPPSEPPQARKTFQVAYAGSIYPMHYDALAAIAEAVFELKHDGEDIELILYTNPSFWNLYQHHWEKWEVIYGSLIPYEELNSYLKQADLLLVATSFLPENSHLVRASVLTKLTDYMVAGRPILACGPNYSASHKFLKTWNCGLLCETNQIKQIKEFLRLQIANRRSNHLLAQKAFAVVKDNFSTEVVNNKLYSFIKSISQIK
ncbi:MAG: hypothetical protein SAL07_19395 [Oscillatoria sp. PMC 1051.18]|nr:hypothetical protein [Oscillatoria sp. PMC 1050.18]MEC5032070.1 hypothetical protein [Oscillatoria sp. PMC 1051.18]